MLRSPPDESETVSGSEVSPREGNRAWRDERQEVAVLHSTAEPGELAPTRTRWREGMHQVTTLPEGNMAETSDSENVYTKQRQIAE